MLVEGAGEVALQQPVIIYCFGHNAPYKLEVAQVVGVTVRGRIDGVGDSIARRCAEERIHGVKHLP